LNLGHTEVLHQICKIMTGTRQASNLVAFVANTIGAKDYAYYCHGRKAFESHPVVWRAHIIQLSSWLLADPKVRIPAAWYVKAVRYNHLARDFPSSPAWYLAITEPLNRAGNHRHHDR
jgi:hypothetical protein